MCQQTLRKFADLLVDATGELASVSITFGDDTKVNVPCVLALQAPGVRQIAATALKLKWSSPESAHDRIAEDVAPSLAGLP